MALGIRPPFFNPLPDYSNPLLASIKHAWFTAPIFGSSTGTNGKQHMVDILRRGAGWNAGITGDNVGVSVGQLGFGVVHTGGNDVLATANNAERYGGSATVPITIAVWVKLPATINEFGTMISKYSDQNNHDGFAFYTFNTTNRLNTFGLSYNAGATYQEAHAGSPNILTGGETVLLAWSGKFGTASSHVLYKNGKPITPTWFTNDGTANLNDDDTTPSPYRITQDVWNQPLGSGGTIYSVMLWDRMLSSAEHMQLYDPLTRWSFILDQKLPKFWAMPYYSLPPQNISDNTAIYIPAKTQYALRPDGNI